MQQQQPPVTGVFGASPGTGNQGVDALCWSTLSELAARGCGDIHLFGYGVQHLPRSGNGPLPGTQHTFHEFSAGRRAWRRNHLGRARLAALTGTGASSVARAVAGCDAVLDLSGGDSFTDLYGQARFRAVLAPKEIALALRRPLILLPQTYGPFEAQDSRRRAQAVLRRVELAWARDADSFVRLRALLGEDFDPARHREGVDVAFALAPRASAQVDTAVGRLLADRAVGPLIGLNVSGLVANEPEAAAQRFGLRCDYRLLLREFLSRLLRESDARILLIPHVHAPEGHPESDLAACRALLHGLPAPLAGAAAARVAVVPGRPDACELKWLIGQCDWFCGTRMHATIAALSSGVPVAALAYSLKTRGVFASCALEGAVVDLRHTTSAEALERLLQLFATRAGAAATLAQRLPAVRARCARQFDEIAAHLHACSQGLRAAC